MAIRAIATDSQDFNNPSTTGKPGRDERLDFKNEAGDTVFSIVSDADGAASIQGDAVPKVYRALLTQSSTDAPTATVLENTLGGTVVWTRDGVGRYVGTLAGAFPADKTFCTGGTWFTNNGDTYNWSITRVSSDALSLYLTRWHWEDASTNNFTYDELSDFIGAIATALPCVEILVYP